MKKWRIKKDNKMRAYGETDFNKKLIRINKKKSRTNPSRVRPINKGATRYPDVLDTIKHELMHRAHPKMTEDTVHKKTEAWLKKARAGLKRKLYAKVK